MLTSSDHRRVTELLGREPRGDYQIAVRDADGGPVVLRNAPLLDDGTPMPTLYWLIGLDEIKRVGQIESDGGVNRAEADIGMTAIAAAHDRYAAERDAQIPVDHTGHRPTGGVGGTRVGVKCLHAHWAWHLAGGDDPVGRWVEAELTARAAPRAVDVYFSNDQITVCHDDATTVLDTTINSLNTWLGATDPTEPADLANAIGVLTDELDELLRQRPELAGKRLALSGDDITSFARLEAGRADIACPVSISREQAEDVFRLLASERLDERADHPGVDTDFGARSLAVACAVVSLLRSCDRDRFIASTVRASREP